MPRGSQKSLEEKFAELEAKKSNIQGKIDGLQEKISDLDSQIDELKQAKKQKELENLLDIIKASGKTPEEVIAALNK